MKDYAAQAIRCEPVKAIYGTGTDGAFVVMREPLHPDTVKILEMVIRKRCAEAAADATKRASQRAVALLCLHAKGDNCVRRCVIQAILAPWLKCQKGCGRKRSKRYLWCSKCMNKILNPQPRRKGRV